MSPFAWPALDSWRREDCYGEGAGAPLLEAVTLTRLVDGLDCQSAGRQYFQVDPVPRYCSTGMCDEPGDAAFEHDDLRPVVDGRVLDMDDVGARYLAANVEERQTALALLVDIAADSMIGGLNSVIVSPSGVRTIAAARSMPICGTAMPMPRRTVADLLDAAARQRAGRERRMARQRVEDGERRKQAHALARERRLDRLAEEEEAAWLCVNTLIATRKPADYDAAVTMLTDLQTLAEREDRDDGFVLRAIGLGQTHGRDPAEPNVGEARCPICASASQ